jgi:DNA-binding response OmpR family regulator
MMKENADILIVEDSPTQREQLRFLLEEHGFAVRAAGDGRKALAEIEVRRPELVISDIVMPELDGHGLCRAIKEDEGLREIPVILLTTLSDREDILRGLEARADCYCTKPYDEEHLLERIAFHLDHAAPVDGGGGLEIDVDGSRHVIRSSRWEILCLLLSTYGSAVRQNQVLSETQLELRKLNEELEERVEERTRELRQAHARLEHQVRELDGRDRLVHFQMSAHSLEESCAAVLEVLNQAFGAQRAVLYRPRDEGGLLAAAAMGLSSPGRMEEGERLAELPVLAAAEEGPEVRAFREKKVHQGSDGAVAVPCMYGDEVLGILRVEALADEADEELLGGLWRLGGEAALVLHGGIVTEGLEDEMLALEDLEGLE